MSKTMPGRAKIEPGTHLVYSEDDWIAEVEVLSDTSDDGWRRYELKVIKTINPTQMYDNPKDGHIFQADQKVGYGFCWTLEPMPKEAIKA